MKFVTLDKMKSHLEVTGTTHYDSKITDIVDAVECEILNIVPYFREMDWNSTFVVGSCLIDMPDCDDEIVLEHMHVSSIIALTETESSSLISPDDYVLKKSAGIIKKKTGNFISGVGAYDVSYTVVAGSTPSDITGVVINSVKRQFTKDDEDPTLPNTVRRFKEGDKEIENAPAGKLTENLTDEQRKIIYRYRDPFRVSTSRFAQDRT